MSLQPQCLTPKDLETLEFKVFRGGFFKAVKRLAKKHNSQATAVPFFLNAKQKFKDNPEAFFMIFGKMAKWKAHSKAAAVKEPALRGLCFASVDEASGVLKLSLMPVAGKLKSKENVIVKGLKTVVAAGKCQIEILQGEFSEDLLERMEQATENLPDEPDTPEVEDAPSTQAPTGEKPKPIPAAVLVLLRQLGTAIAQLQSKETKTKGGRFRQQLINLIIKVMNGLDEEIKALPEAQKKAIEARKEYQYAKTVLDRINAQKGKDKPGSKTDEPAKPEDKGPQASPEQKAEFEQSMKELKETFARAGVSFSL